MGARQSGMAGTGGLGDFPECCVAMILARLDPPEICRFAMLNRAFRRASLADFVWESKLPANYEYLVRKLFDESPNGKSKREIYSWFCKGVRFDAATKEIWLEKGSGRMCMAISWKGLKITGIDDRRYWSHIPCQESRFHSIAYLHQVWWLEVTGELDFNFPAGTYSLYFRLHLGKAPKGLNRRACNLDQVHGWDIKPVRFQMSASNGQQAISQCYLKEAGSWVGYHVGDFTVENHHVPLNIKFAMTQIDCTHTKGGLCLDCVIICPCESAEALKRAQVL
uniref:F-box domain-containing protein n=1 Tax=Opuntia streptacantha TaxID=393608 RepID=A0A7C9AZI9_OPUST